MSKAILISSIYLALLFLFTKIFGIKYTEIINNNENIKKGIIYPVGIATIFLTVYALIFNWLPEVFSFSPTVNQPILWLVPFAIFVGIVARFLKLNKKAFQKNGFILLAIATLIVGFSEELLVRGIAVNSLLNSGYSVLLTGIISSFIFGLLHFINYFNGQDIKKTTVQVIGTILMGLNFYIIFIITGSLWAPIIFHFLFDFSILAMGNKPKLDNADPVANIIAISTFVSYVLPVVFLFFL
jgi:membrane protease YdiL (CAAX protease family)